jgi:GntR family transcriptional regulator
MSATPVFSPLYRQIADLMIRALEQAEWQPGEAIPSELELAARFKVSQGTVRKAIEELTAANLVVRRQGRGTFVATHAEARTQFRFLRLAADDARAEAMTRRFLSCKRARPPGGVARALELAPGEPGLQVRRVLNFRGAPVVYDELWLPQALFKGLTGTRLEAWPGTLYGLFEAEYGVRMIRAEEQIRAVAADPDAAALLGLAPGAALLDVQRLAFTYGDRPVEWRRGLYDTREHHYRNSLN